MNEAFFHLSFGVKKSPMQVGLRVNWLLYVYLYRYLYKQLYEY